MLWLFHLQSINGENIIGLVRDEARPDVKAKSIWRNRKSPSLIFVLKKTTANSHYRHHQPKILEIRERKKSQYNHRVINIEHGTFTPLVFSISLTTNIWLKRSLIKQMKDLCLFSSQLLDLFLLTSVFT